MRDRTVSADDHAGPHLRPDPSRADTGGRGSVGSRGDSYDSLAETVNGLYKAELIRRRRSWRTVEEVELATAGWVDWWNHRRLHSACGDIPPAEFEAAYARLREVTSAA